MIIHDPPKVRKLLNINVSLFTNTTEQFPFRKVNGYVPLFPKAPGRPLTYKSRLNYFMLKQQTRFPFIFTNVFSDAVDRQNFQRMIHNCNVCKGIQCYLGI